MDEETYDQFGLPHADVADELAILPPSSSVQMLAVDGKPAGIQLPASVELAVAADGARGARRHRHERDEARDARDRRGRPGAAVRRHGRAHQGRSPRRQLHLARLNSTGSAARLRSSAVAKLVDTTIRLLSQEPLAGKLPTAEVLRVAEILDGRVRLPRGLGRRRVRRDRSPRASRARGSASARSRRASRRRSALRCGGASSSARAPSAATSSAASSRARPRTASTSSASTTR